MFKKKNFLFTLAVFLVPFASLAMGEKSMRKTLITEEDYLKRSTTIEGATDDDVFLKGRMSELKNCQKGPEHNVFAKAERSLVRISTWIKLPDGQEFGVNGGSGLVVSEEGHIVTNKHVSHERLPWFTETFTNLMEGFGRLQEEMKKAPSQELSTKMQMVSMQLFSMINPEVFEKALKLAMDTQKKMLESSEETYRAQLEAELAQLQSGEAKPGPKKIEKKMPPMMNFSVFAKGINPMNFFALLPFVTGFLKNGEDIFAEGMTPERVAFLNGHKYKIEKVLNAEHHDLSLVKIVDAVPGQKFDFMTYGDERDYFIAEDSNGLGLATSVSGEEIATLGFPFLTEIPSLSVSILSNRVMNVPHPKSPARYMKINDGSVNPGNSGGPAFVCAKKAYSDEPGELVPFAINTMIMAPNGNSGIAMSIPGSLIKKFVDQGIKYGEYKSIDSLGINIGVREETNSLFREVTIDNVRAGEKLPGLSYNPGMLVPTYAQRLGLEKGDLLLKYNGFELDGKLPLLVALVKETTTEEDIEVIVDRNGQIVTLTMEALGPAIHQAHN